MAFTVVSKGVGLTGGSLLEVPNIVTLIKRTLKATRI